MSPLLAISCKRRTKMKQFSLANLFHFFPLLCLNLSFPKPYQASYLGSACVGAGGDHRLPGRCSTLSGHEHNLTNTVSLSYLIFASTVSVNCEQIFFIFGRGVETNHSDGNKVIMDFQDISVACCQS